jgi:hypothetical protein
LTAQPLNRAAVDRAQRLTAMLQDLYSAPRVVADTAHLYLLHNSLIYKKLGKWAE